MSRHQIVGQAPQINKLIMACFFLSFFFLIWFLLLLCGEHIEFDLMTNLKAA